MSVVSRLAFVGVVLLLAACGSAKDVSDNKCPFTYNRTVVDSMVIPKLKEVYGDNYIIYDLSKPGILELGDRVQLIFRQPRIDVLDTPNFIVEIDRCSLQVIKAYEASPFPSDAPLSSEKHGAL